MRMYFRAILVGSIILSLFGTGYAETAAEHNQRMAWWREARFGMFIHWGIMSIPGKDCWVMNNDKIPKAEYEKLVAQYNPVQWNAHDVVKMAKEAGQKYLVFVAKHHDGFCMWDTKLTDYNIMRSPYAKDIVRQLADECAKQGIVFCFYYSILDWHHPDATKEHWPKYVEYMKGQLRELLTNYGPIGVVWFDGDWIPEWTDDQGRKLAQYIWSLQPKTVINNRIGKGRQGMEGSTKKGHFAADFDTPEQEVPANGLPGVDWESCMTINGSWSWNKTDLQHKSTADCIRLLVDTVSKGGNLLLNIGPHPDGSILQSQQERLRDIGLWMKINEEAIYRTSASPFTKQLPWGRCTQKDLPEGRTRLYLHVFDWPKDGKLVVPGLSNQIAAAFLLADPQQAPLKCEAGKEQVVVVLPIAPSTPHVSVVAIDLVGKPKIAAASVKTLTKLPEKFCRSVMESTPITFNGQSYLFGCYRPSGDCGKLIEQNYLAIYDPASYRELVRFGVGHSLGSAFVDGNKVHIYAAEAKTYADAITKDNWFQNIYHFWSTDLKTWNRELAVSRENGEHLLNSSVCRDEQGYLMAYETDVPVSFCFKFARSKDLSRWEKIPGLVFTGEKNEYSACPMIRYFRPYYYVIYLHAAIPGHNGWVSFLARSKDLVTWQLAPKNPILEASEGEGCNNSDIDIIESDGKTYVYYATGDQQTWNDLKRAVYPGPMQEFFESYFPEGANFAEVRAKPME